MGIATHVPNRFGHLPIVVVCPIVPLSATSIICLNDFTIFWFAYTLLCVVSTDIWDLMSYHKESSMSFAFSSMSYLLLNSAVIPLHRTSFCKEGLKAASSCLLNE